MATKEQAQQAVFDSVAVLAEQAGQHGGQVASAMLRDVALAYRYAAGGPQPGAGSVSSK